MNVAVVANRQSPSRPEAGAVPVPVRDAEGHLITHTDLVTASVAIVRGAAVWRGRGRRRYLLLLASLPGRSGWAIAPSTEPDGVRGLFGKPRRHSRAASWRTAPDLDSLLMTPGGGSLLAAAGPCGMDGEVG
jgi:hypothetical protein